MNNRPKRVVVTGAGGFIGHHLVKKLKSIGHWVRGVDIKYPEYEVSASDEFEILDLRTAEHCLSAARGGIDEVYNLAADMGGIGYITAQLLDDAVVRNSLSNHWRRILRLWNGQVNESPGVGGISKALLL